MVFYITPIIEGRLRKLKVERVFHENYIEHFEVTARNKKLTLQTNRLLFLSKGLKHRRGQWKIIAGTLNNFSALQKIIAAIEEKIESE
ncbi:MAG: hypothetical protein JST87_03450 [Bacteroidetes bacterium]|nr:hypothetical protein [Bacteroidota bacterium]MBS1933617.1 hypothetical protein [Bacteroidota bacterium]